MFWIVSGRFAIEKVVSNCFFSEISRAKLMYPYMTDLPDDRVAYREAPFTNCGCPLTGPVFIKQDQKELKRWIVLFICLTAQCTLFEVLANAATDSVINALPRFVNQRGRPEDMYSDRGTNFVGAIPELQEFFNELNQEQI